MVGELYAEDGPRRRAYSTSPQVAIPHDTSYSKSDPSIPILTCLQMLYHFWN